MRRLILSTLLLVACALGATAQNELYIYQHSGVTDTLQLGDVTGIRHLRTGLDGRQHDDYVVMSVAMQDETVRSYLLADLDSVVMARDGARIRLTRFVGGSNVNGDGMLRNKKPVPLKTSMDGDFMASASTVDFYWEDGDNIYIRPEETVMTADSVFIRTAKETAEFYFKSGNISGEEVTVYYPGQAPPSTDGQKVRVKSNQSQDVSNTTVHIGTSGDCGTAVARKPEGKSYYYFDLEHKAAYLCFLPYIANDLGRTVLKKVTVRSDKAIAGVFDLTTDGLTLASEDNEAAHTITLTTGGNAGFMLPKTANQSTSAYMVIAPQATATRLTCEFTVYDTVLESEGVYTKMIDLTEIAPNMVYVIKANCNNYVVDLGLPVKFLNHNMGAFSPEDYGGYYAFGELEDKGNFTTSNYAYQNTPVAEMAEIRLTEKDVAHMRFGLNFSMPTNAEMRMLTDSCTSQWTTVNGHAGRLVMGKNGNHLFFPAAGYRSESSTSNLNTQGYYRTSTLLPNGVRRNWQYHINNSTEKVNESDEALYRGLTVRPVVSSGVQMTDGTVVQVMTDSVSWQVGQTTAKLYGTQYGLEKSLSPVAVGFLIGSKEDVEAGHGTKLTGTLSGNQRTFSADFTSVEDLNVYYYRSYVEVGDSVSYGSVLYFGRTYVDLGLPSGTKWANINLDAITDLQSGDYYAWGETEAKSTYTQANHKWYQESTYVFPEGLRDVQATRHDAAAVKWGGSWMLPTYTEIKELYDNCTIQKDVYYNGIRGYLFTSKVAGYTDRSIFVPKTGYMSSVVNNFLNDHYVVSTTLLQSDNRNAYQIANGNVTSDWNHYYGKNFRPVYKTNATSKTGKPMYIRMLPIGRKVDGTTEYDTLKAVVRGLPADGTKVGFAWWQEGHEDSKTFVEAVPDADSYIQTVVTGLTAGCTYYYTAYIDNGGAEYAYVNSLTFDVVGMVDLGLSVKWANVNLGAENEEAYGECYRWGATEPYRKKSQQYTPNNDITPESGRDICTNTWGASFRMPTKTECEELTNQENCQWTWVTLSNGVRGYRVTSKKEGYTDRSIFIPAAGYYMDNGEYYINGDWSDYWSSSCYDASKGYQFGFNKEVANVKGNYSNNKSYGFTVRAVSAKSDYIKTIRMNRYTLGASEVDTLICYYGHVVDHAVTVGFLLGDNADIEAGQSGVEELVITNPVNGFNSFVKTGLEKGRMYYYRAFVRDGESYSYGDVMQFELLDYVDLGLSSGNLWANINLGAEHAEAFGKYYAWGETTPKTTYTEGNYQWKQNNQWVGIGTDISGTEYDAVTANLGSMWQMPTQAECLELINGTDREVITKDGVNYWKFMNKTDHSKYIILPNAGRWNGSAREEAGKGYYITSTLYDSDEYRYFYLPTSGTPQAASNYYQNRWKGNSVRAIIRASEVSTASGSTLVQVKTIGYDWPEATPTTTLQGRFATSAPVSGATYGFVVGGITDVEQTTPEAGHLVAASQADETGAYTVSYTPGSSDRFFRAYLKVGDTYYLGDIKSLNPVGTCLLDVEFLQDGSAINAAFTHLKPVKVGTPVVSYYNTMKSYAADLASISLDANQRNTHGGNAKNYYKYDYAYQSAFKNSLTDGHTLECMMMLPSVPSANSEADALANFESGGSGVGIYNKKFFTQFYIGGSYRQVYVDNPSIAANTWYHVVAVWDKNYDGNGNAKLSIYVDGVLKNELTTNVSGTHGLPNDDRSYFVVGGNPASNNPESGWYGSVAFARIYDKPLTADEVSTLYQKIKD